MSGKITLHEWNDKILESIETENIDLFGYDFKLLKHERISSKIKDKGIYESAQTRLMTLMLNVGGNFIDVGANIGYYTMWMNRMGVGRSWVHSFEPNPLPFAILSENVKKNGLDRVTLNNAAVGRTSGTIGIDLALSLPDAAVQSDDYNLGGWSLQRKKPGSFQVKMISLDDYVEEKQLDSVKFIKIDVEGFEPEVLAGADTVLRKMRPHLLIEFGAPNAKRRDQILDIMDFLSERKYNLARVENKPFPHLRRMRPEDTAEFPFRFYVFACRMELDFLGG